MDWARILADIATVARPDTILGWYRKLVARKFDGSTILEANLQPVRATAVSITAEPIKSN